VLEWKKVIFMRDKVGQAFTGIVTGVAPFGLFVELDAIFVQGMVPIATVGGDFWQYREREHRLRGESTGRELRLGDHVLVEVKSIDEDRHQIEFRLLETFMARIGRVQTREQLLHDVWEMTGELQTRTVDTHVKRLREKLGSGRDLIETVRGIGYRMTEPSAP